MSFLSQPSQVVLAVLSETIRKEQQKVIEYLQLENQILREKLGGKRVLHTDDQRRLLAVCGKALGRQQLGKIATIAQADTILRWHRELIEPSGFPSDCRAGRPPTDQEVVDLVVRMAGENVSWGHKRIAGALHNLGYTICSSTVANILKQHGIPPAPMRKRQLSWSTFLKSHLDVFAGIDLDTIILWLSELASYVFGHISPHGRAIPCPPVVVSNDEMLHPTIHTNRNLQIAETVTQPIRGPPTVAPPSISPHQIRDAA